MTTTTDTQKPSPLFIFTVHKAPVLPTFRHLKSGDDVEAILIEELGGEPIDMPLTQEDVQLGLLRMAKHENVMAQVHSHPDAEKYLREVVVRLEKEVKLVDALRAAGLIPPEADEHGCICGQCERPEDREVDPATAN